MRLFRCWDCHVVTAKDEPPTFKKAGAVFGFCVVCKVATRQTELVINQVPLRDRAEIEEIYEP